ncbi:hypothetical protein HDV05_006263 [Chytridiales sp. JEL 0842]|nr:hypothetical protein HDV05_006263 [Chytridiales sp. JEL 0842]
MPSEEPGSRVAIRMRTLPESLFFIKLDDTNSIQNPFIDQDQQQQQQGFTVVDTVCIPCAPCSSAGAEQGNASGSAAVVGNDYMSLCLEYEIPRDVAPGIYMFRTAEPFGSVSAVFEVKGTFDAPFSDPIFPTMMDIDSSTALPLQRRFSPNSEPASAAASPLPEDHNSTNSSVRLIVYILPSVLAFSGLLVIGTLLLRRSRSQKPISSPSINDDQESELIRFPSTSSLSSSKNNKKDHEWTQIFEHRHYATMQRQESLARREHELSEALGGVLTDIHHHQQHGYAYPTNHYFGGIGGYGYGYGGAMYVHPPPAALTMGSQGIITHGGHAYMPSHPPPAGGLTWMWTHPPPNPLHHLVDPPKESASQAPPSPLPRAPVEGLKPLQKKLFDWNVKEDAESVLKSEFSSSVDWSSDATATGDLKESKEMYTPPNEPHARYLAPNSVARDPLTPPQSRGTSPRSYLNALETSTSNQKQNQKLKRNSSHHIPVSTEDKDINVKLPPAIQTVVPHQHHSHHPSPFSSSDDAKTVTGRQVQTHVRLRRARSDLTTPPTNHSAATDKTLTPIKPPAPVPSSTLPSPPHAPVPTPAGLRRFKSLNDLKPLPANVIEDLDVDDTTPQQPPPAILMSAPYEPSNANPLDQHPHQNIRFRKAMLRSMDKKNSRSHEDNRSIGEVANDDGSTFGGWQVEAPATSSRWRRKLERELVPPVPCVPPRFSKRDQNLPPNKNSSNDNTANSLNEAKEYQLPLTEGHSRHSDNDNRESDAVGWYLSILEQSRRRQSTISSSSSTYTPPSTSSSSASSTLDSDDSSKSSRLVEPELKVLVPPLIPSSKPPAHLLNRLQQRRRDVKTASAVLNSARG